MERGGTEEAEASRKRLMLVAYTATWDHGYVQARLLLRIMSDSVALPQPGSVRMSVAYIT